MMQDKGRGRLVIVSAPSGAGKSTIVRALLNNDLGLQFSVSACNRPPRAREQDGREYYFLSTEDFLRRVAAGDFLEWEEVYPGRYYGTLRSEVERILAAGRHVIFDVDVLGGMSIKREYGERALAVYIMPPSLAVLEERLRKRSTETEEELAVRLARAGEELRQASAFDLQVVNEHLQTAIREVGTAVALFLETGQIPPRHD